jgi:hypothetical protein
MPFLGLQGEQICMKRLAAGILDIHPSANAKTEVEVVIKMLTIHCVTDTINRFLRTVRPRVRGMEDEGVIQADVHHDKGKNLPLER